MLSTLICITRRYCSGFSSTTAAATDADIVIEEIEAAPARHGGFNQPFAVGLLGDVAGQRCRRAAFRRNHCHGTFGKPELAIGDQHFGAGARQQDRRRPAVADAVARRPAATHQRDFAGQPGVFLGSLHHVSSFQSRTIATPFTGEKAGVEMWRRTPPLLRHSGARVGANPESIAPPSSRSNGFRACAKRRIPE
jgi:hypothetical protein